MHGHLFNVVVSIIVLPYTMPDSPSPSSIIVTVAREGLTTTLIPLFSTNERLALKYSLSSEELSCVIGTHNMAANSSTEHKLCWSTTLGREVTVLFSTSDLTAIGQCNVI